MGLKVTGVNALNMSLMRATKNSSRALRRIQEDAAAKIQETAIDFAPVDMGDLESAIQRSTERDFKAKRDYVFVDTDAAPYAIYMHEGFGVNGSYNLGPKSAAKDAGTGRVGMKFFERAVDHVLNGLGYLEKARDAVRRQLK